MASDAVGSPDACDSSSISFDLRLVVHVFCSLLPGIFFLLFSLFVHGSSTICSWLCCVLLQNVAQGTNSHHAKLGTGWSGPLPASLERPRYSDFHRSTAGECLALSLKEIDFFVQEFSQEHGCPVLDLHSVRQVCWLSRQR